MPKSLITILSPAVVPVQNGVDGGLHGFSLPAMAVCDSERPRHQSSGIQLGALAPKLERAGDAGGDRRIAF